MGGGFRNVQTIAAARIWSIHVPVKSLHQRIGERIGRALAVGGFGGAAVRPGREPSPPLKTLTVQVYLKQLALALVEASESSDPRVLAFAIKRAAIDSTFQQPCNC